MDQSPSNASKKKSKKVPTAEEKTNNQAWATVGRLHQVIRCKIWMGSGRILMMDGLDANSLSLKKQAMTTMSVLQILSCSTDRLINSRSIN